MTSIPGVSIRIGRRNVQTFMEADKIIQLKLKAVQRELGELTRPFAMISKQLVPRIKSRFDKDQLSGPPFRDSVFNRSPWTVQARRARSQNEDGPTLLASGNLRDAITRKDSPTKAPSGAQREVFRLVIGIEGGNVPYHKKQLEGGIWDVPVIKLEKKGKVRYYFDPDQLEGDAMSSSSFHGPILWGYIKDEERTTIPVPIPATNYMLITPVEEKIISSVFNTWLRELGPKTKWSE